MLEINLLIFLWLISRGTKIFMCNYYIKVVINIIITTLIIILIIFEFVPKRQF